jgi:hypothetical protein
MIEAFFKLNEKYHGSLAKYFRTRAANQVN